MRNEFARVSVFISPPNFFDEIIVEEGGRVDGWKLYVQKMEIPVGEKDGSFQLNDAARLIAEIELDEKNVFNFDKMMLPNLVQILDSLAGLRNAIIPGRVHYTMWQQDFVKEGVSRRMHPIRIEIGVKVRVHKSSEALQVERKAKESSRKMVLDNLKKELSDISKKYFSAFSNEYFRRAWENFGLAFTGEKDDFSHLYSVRDSIQEGLKRTNVRAELSVSKDDWRRFGEIYNNYSIEGGRHLGRHPEPTKPMSDEQKKFVVDFAKKLLFSYGDYLIERGERWHHREVSALHTVHDARRPAPPSTN